MSNCTISSAFLVFNNGPCRNGLDAKSQLLNFRIPLLRYFLLILCFVALFNESYAQSCPSSISISSTDITVADCPSSGAITVHSNVESVTTATYQIVSGPTGGGYQTTPQSPNAFTSLPAGNYTIRVTCGSATADVTVNVANTYTPLTLSATVSNECAGSTAGGTITATGGGGKPGLQYAFLKSTNAAEPDGNFTYGASNTYTATSFGQYQVRVKDACNNFTTRSVEIAPIKPKGKFITGTPNYSCSGTTFTNNSLVGTVNNLQISPVNAGYIVDIWNQLPGESCTTAPTRASDFSTTVNSQSDIASVTVPATVNKIIVRTISPCGEVFIECRDVTHAAVQATGSVHVGCTPTDNVSIKFNIYGGIAPYSIVGGGFESDGVTPVPNTTINVTSWNLNGTYTYPVADRYQFTITDACGNTLTTKYITPKPGDGGKVTATGVNTWCVDEIGKLSVIAYLDGYIPVIDASDFELVTTSGVHVAYGINYNAINSSITFIPVSPGDYLIRVTTKASSACPGVVTDIPITVASQSYPTGLKLALSGTTSQLCGGTGSITTTLDYNGGQLISYQLLDGSGTVLSTNATGTFTNLPSGNYTVKAIMDLSSCGKANLETTKDFVIQPAGTAPVVLKKLGISCDADPATGQAIFEFSGFGPFLVEMKKTTETTYVIKGVDVPNTYTVTSLDTGSDYDVRITDKCGTTAVTQVSIKPLTNVKTTTTAQPCVNQPYTLSLEDIPTATYSWTFNGGPVISTNKDVTFANYTAANDGQYVCTIKIGECVTRTTTVDVSSTKCGNPLPVTLSLFGVKKESQTALITWATTEETNADRFEVQRSANSKLWKTIATVAAQGESKQLKKYSYVDNTPLNGENLYRLRMVDKDNTYSFSRIQSVKFDLQVTASVYPNPVSDVVFVKDLNLSEKDIKEVSIINSNGKVVRQSASVPAGGINVKDLPAGVYVMRIKEVDSTEHAFKVVIAR